KIKELSLRTAHRATEEEIAVWNRPEQPHRFIPANNFHGEEILQCLGDFGRGLSCRLHRFLQLGIRTRCALRNLEALTELNTSYAELREVHLREPAKAERLSLPGKVELYVFSRAVEGEELGCVVFLVDRRGEGCGQPSLRKVLAEGDLRDGLVLFSDDGDFVLLRCGIHSSGVGDPGSEIAHLTLGLRARFEFIAKNGCLRVLLSDGGKARRSK